MPTYSATGGGGGPSSVDVIAGTKLTAPAATFDFASIPATYAALKVVVSGRVDTAATYESLAVQFNGDATASYDWTRHMQEQGAVIASHSNGQTALRVGYITAGGTTAGRRAEVTIWVPDYADTTFNKGCHSEFYYPYTSTGEQHGIGKHAGQWGSAAAIDRLTLAPAAGNFVTGSRATLYGLRGA